MDTAAPTGLLGLALATYAYCLVSGLVPVVNTEVYLLSVSALAPRHVALTLILASTCGQMTAKSLMYLVGRGALKLPLGRHEARLEQAGAALQRWRGRTDLLLFASAFTGLPPFYALSIVAGTLRHNFARFFCAGFLGRLLRFAALVLFPQALK